MDTTAETIPTTDDEPFPWDVPDVPYVHHVSASLAVTAATPIEVFDRPNDDPAFGRVMGLRIGDVTLMLGFGDDEDASLIEVADTLIGALGTLRAAAEARCL